MAALVGWLVSLGVADVPLYPSRYQVKGAWVLPQVHPHIRQAAVVNTDLVAGVQSESVFGGLWKSLRQIGKASMFFQVYRPVDSAGNLSKQSVCITGSDVVASLHDYLPNLSDWSFRGETVVLGKNVSVWEKVNDEGTYSFYADSLGNPVRFLQRGSSIAGGAPMIYYFDFDSYGALPDLAALVEPSCPDFPLPPPAGAPVVGFAGEVPANFSWRSLPGILPPVGVEGNCRAGWAFAAAGVLNSRLAIQGVDRRVSVQQFVDCAWNQENQGCCGGSAVSALAQVSAARLALANQTAYPYIASPGYCPDVVEESGYQVFVANTIPSNATAMKAAVFKDGPIAASIRAYFPAFKGLTAGQPYLVNASECRGTPQADHNVLVTGWQTINGATFWEIQNSWSADWGDAGYGYIDSTADCGILQNAGYAQLMASPPSAATQTMGRREL